MFKRSFRGPQDQNRVDKAVRLKKSGVTTSGSFRDQKTSAAKLQRSLTEQDGNLYGKYPARSHHQRGGHSDHHVRHNVAHGDYGYSASDGTMRPSPSPPSPIVTLTVGNEGRLFAAHEDVLCQAPFFEAACRGNFFADAQNRRIALPDEEPEVFSAVLEFLYKGDYYPRLVRSGSGRDSWELEDQLAEKKMQQHLQQVSPYATPPMEHGASPRVSEAGATPTTTTATAAALADSVTVYLASIDAHILRDTVVYCAATRYGLDALARLALRKQGLHSGIDVATILRSAQYAYANTPDSDSRLRAHYLALIIRCRKTFKRSGTMQMEMERGGTKLFFDLFVAMCNHLDDVMEVGGVKSPRT